MKIYAWFGNEGNDMEKIELIDPSGQLEKIDHVLEDVVLDAGKVNILLSLELVIRPNNEKRHATVFIPPSAFRRVFEEEIE